MATIGEVINGSLRLLGVLAEGETPSADTSTDALTAFNQMIESWSAERLAVYATQDQTFTWAASVASRTLGPSGDFVGTRPIQVLDSTYFRVNNLSYPIQLINEEQYTAIALKSSTSTYPGVMWVNYDYPNITMKIYPVPMLALEMHIFSVLPLVEVTNLATTLTVPPGYVRAFRYNLACELAPEFGLEPTPQVKRIADVSKRTLKRINNPGDLMSMPYSLLSHRRGNFNIFTGNVN